MVNPPVYPWSAFESRRFLLGRQAPILPDIAKLDRSKVHATSEALRDRLLVDYDRVAYDRCGVLRGEFAVAGDGLHLFDRAGACISINFPNESSNVAQQPYQTANHPQIQESVREVYSDWQNVRLVENAAVLSHIYYDNYFHYTFEYIQKIRHLADYDVGTILTPNELMRRPFQRDLLSRAMGPRTIVPLTYAVRVRDPVIVQTYLSAEAIWWARGLFQPAAPPDGRKYFVRRSPEHRRPGNNLAETEGLRRLLSAHGFIEVDFGNGENSIQDQINMLAGASVVLSPHGAGLTNLAYLNAPLRIVEVFGRGVLSNSFMRISSTLGFDHHAVISDELDAEGDIVVDCELLDEILRLP